MDVYNLYSVFDLGGISTLTKQHVKLIKYHIRGYSNIVQPFCLKSVFVVAMNLATSLHNSLRTMAAGEPVTPMKRSVLQVGALVGGCRLSCGIGGAGHVGMVGGAPCGPIGGRVAFRSLVCLGGLSVCGVVIINKGPMGSFLL